MLCLSRILNVGIIGAHHLTTKFDSSSPLVKSDLEQKCLKCVSFVVFQSADKEFRFKSFGGNKYNIVMDKKLTRNNFPEKKFFIAR